MALLERLKGREARGPKAGEPKKKTEVAAAGPSPEAAYQELKSRVHNRLFENLDTALLRAQRLALGGVASGERELRVPRLCQPVQGREHRDDGAAALDELQLPLSRSARARVTAGSSTGASLDFSSRIMVAIGHIEGRK